MVQKDGHHLSAGQTAPHRHAGSESAFLAPSPLMNVKDSAGWPGPCPPRSHDEVLYTRRMRCYMAQSVRLELESKF